VDRRKVFSHLWLAVIINCRPNLRSVIGHQLLEGVRILGMQYRGDAQVEVMLDPMKVVLQMAFGFFYALKYFRDFTNFI
jgi:hypothetical protein